jgi:hypothetical protein
VAYFLEALVFRAGVAPGELPSSVARIVSLPQISLIPLTDEVLAAVRNDVETWARRESQRDPVAYIVAEYFGGVGNQFSIVWSGGEIVLGPLRQPDAINQALRLLGIVASDGMDEFDAVGEGIVTRMNGYKMAEPPTILSELLREARYADFINEVRVRGLLRKDQPDLEQVIKQLHASLQAQRHPPGPTVEWLLIDRLVRMQILRYPA